MKNILRTAAILLALVCVLSGCAPAFTQIEVPDNATTLLPLGEQLTLSDTDTTIAENERFTLSVNSEFLNIRVTDRLTGRVWSTNQEEPDMDAVALSDTIDLLKAQLQLEYYDKNGNWGTMNSYTDCVANEQYTLHAIPNGLAVTYSFGNLARTVDDIPQKMTGSRFEEKLLSKLSEEDRRLLSEEYYKYYESEDMWSVMKKGRNNYQDILELMDKAGYTAEDLVEDNRMFGLSVTSTSRIGFVVRVYYYLTEKGLTVEIPAQTVEYSEEYPLYDISFLPNFGSQKLTDANKEGFLFVPDGSGALLRFDSNVSSSYYYQSPVYGWDEVVTLRSNTRNVNSEATSLPVFGISDGTAGFVAYIADGAANAKITASRAGRNSEQYTVYPTFSFLNMDYVTISGSTSASKTPVFQQDPYTGSFKVEYLIPEQCASYVDMATTFRSYLESAGMLKKLESAEENIPFYLETVGGAYGPKNFWGLAYTGVVSTTSYEENIAIAESLSEKGVKNIQLRLLGWCNNGYYPDYFGKVKLIGALGGSSGFDKLTAWCEEQGVELFPDAHLLSGGDDNGFKKDYSARTLDSRYVDGVERMSQSMDMLYYASWVYSPEHLMTLAESFLHSYDRLGLKNLSLADNGDRLFSDYNDTLARSYDRAETQRYVEQQTALLTETAEETMVETGHLYALSGVDHVVHTATDHSWFLAEDEAVPFLQLVLHGRVSLGSKPINMAADYEEQILRCAEYGVYPNYQLCYVSTTRLNETNYSENYTACYLDWVDMAADSWTRLNEVLGAVQTATMSDHKQLSENLYNTTYDNGVCVYVNYGSEDADVDGVTVPAGSFCMKKGG
ncbi:MAG: hypothetical protein J6K98_02145 [Clostridia bacterium]|nr:hypothetical protein [Clostridia bacterium]